MYCRFFIKTKFAKARLRRSKKNSKTHRNVSSSRQTMATCPSSLYAFSLPASCLGADVRYFSDQGLTLEWPHILILGFISFIHRHLGCPHLLLKFIGKLLPVHPLEVCMTTPTWLLMCVCSSYHFYFALNYFSSVTFSSYSQWRVWVLYVEVCYMKSTTSPSHPFPL